jgi:hypothetical protein
LGIEVLSVKRDPSGDVRVGVVVISGQRKVGLPASGQALTLSSGGTDTMMSILRRKKVNERLKDLAWIHREDADAPPKAPRKAPLDPLADLENL